MMSERERKFDFWVARPADGPGWMHFVVWAPALVPAIGIVTRQMRRIWPPGGWILTDSRDGPAQSVDSPPSSHWPAEEVTTPSSKRAGVATFAASEALRG